MEDVKNPQTRKCSILSTLTVKGHIAHTGRTYSDTKMAQLQRPIQGHPNSKNQQAARTSQQGTSVTAGTKGGLRPCKKI